MLEIFENFIDYLFARGIWRIFYFLKPLVMARQYGTIKITGTIDGICFYQMDGEYYARAKSSLSGRRVKTDSAFRSTMAYAGLMGRASKIAAKLKEGLSREERRNINHSKLTGQVQRLLKEGKAEQEILNELSPFKIQNKRSS